ncbi:MAG: hypothetical protein ACPG2Q_10620, partial [Pseudohongiellaceae bacterium]
KLCTSSICGVIAINAIVIVPSIVSGVFELYVFSIVRVGSHQWPAMACHGSHEPVGRDGDL